MKRFSLAFIFSESQKEIVIEGEGNDFNNATFNLVAAFAEKIDFDTHEIELSFYKQNTDHFRQRINDLSDIYKSILPQIQQLPAYFLKQPNDEWFFIAYNSWPSQDELIKIGASLEYLNGGKPYQQTLEEINSIFEGVNSKYEIRTYLGNTRKRFYGEKEKLRRICRYCHKSEAEGARFSQEAHAISDILGNKALYSYDECDSCNDYLGSHCEQDFAEFLRLDRCYFGIKGRDGVPVVRGQNFEMSHPDGQPINIKIFQGEATVSDNINEIQLKYEMEYNPQNLYRALVKYFIGLGHKDKAHFFKNTGTWVKGIDKSNKTISIEKLPPIRKLVSDKYVDRPHIIMYIRKDEDKSLPFAVGEFHIFNYIFAFIVPLTDGDDRDFCSKEDFDRFWEFFKHYSTLHGWCNINANVDKRIKTIINIKFGPGK